MQAALQSQTALSDEQWAEVTQVFHALDRDRTGALSNKVRCSLGLSGGGKEMREDVCALQQGSWFVVRWECSYVRGRERERESKVCGSWCISGGGGERGREGLQMCVNRGALCELKRPTIHDTNQTTPHTQNEPKRPRQRQEFKEGLQGLGVVVEDSEADRTFKTLCQVWGVWVGGGGCARHKEEEEGGGTLGCWSWAK
jgi:hypothetical protein